METARLPVLREIPIEPLSAVAFAPFGRLIATHDSPPDYRGASGRQGWHVPFESGFAASVGGEDALST
jgi:hypothetical protein